MSKKQDTPDSQPVDRKVALSREWDKFQITKSICFLLSAPCIVFGVALWISAKSLEGTVVAVCIMGMAFVALSVATRMQKKLRSLKLEIDSLAATEETRPKPRPRHLKSV